MPVSAAAVSSAPDLSRTHFVASALEELESRHLRYCVLHAWEGLPHYLSSDLDIAVHRKDFWRIPGIIAAMEKRGYRPVQLFNYAVNGYYFVFAWIEDGSVRTAALDFITEHREGSLVLTSAEELVQDRRRFNGFWIPSAAAAYRYLLSKKVLKGAVSQAQSQQLSKLAAELGPAGARRVCARLFGSAMSETAMNATLDGTLPRILGRLKLRMWMRALLRRPWVVLSYSATELPRAFRRFARPTGLLVAVLGPDGVGKSTLIENLGSQFEGAFRDQRVFHWRPGLLFRHHSNAADSDPHGQPSFGPIRSLVHLGGHIADHVLGFLALVRPLLVHSGLALFDRHFHDLLADPARYRYGAPLGIARMLSRIVPRPDLTLVLDAPSAVVMQRKTETTEAQITAAREQYQRMAEDVHAHAIDSVGSSADVALRAAEVVIGVLRRRLERRHPAWLDHANATALDAAAALLAGPAQREERRLAIVPGAARARWLVPVATGISAEDRLAVYAPYAPAARFLKAVLPAALWTRPSISVPVGGSLDELARELLGEAHANFTLSIGAPGRYRKLTVQITATGHICGFLKVPLTAEAKDRLEHEASVLTRLAARPELRGFLPEVLYAGEWNGRFVLLTAPLGGKVGPVRLGGAHRTFLAELAKVESVSRNVSELLDETRAQWEPVAASLDAGVRTAVESSLRRVEREHSQAALSCGVSHGDFAPWNTRMRRNRLGVLDWEAAEWLKPHDWDTLHFQTQTASLLGCAAADTPAHAVSQLLYMIHSLARLVTEQGPFGRDIDYRLQWLRQEGRRG